jgi:hypothetical protein
MYDTLSQPMIDTKLRESSSNIEGVHDWLTQVLRPTYAL